jgi:hypothetical protein
MQGHFGRMFMNCVGRSHRVLKPVNDDAEYLLMQHISIIFCLFLFS